jgi:hypothetical protein
LIHLVAGVPQDVDGLLEPGRRHEDQVAVIAGGDPDRNLAGR